MKRQKMDRSHVHRRVAFAQALLADDNLDSALLRESVSSILAPILDPDVASGEESNDPPEAEGIVARGRCVNAMDWGGYSPGKERDTKHLGAGACPTSVCGLAPAPVLDLTHPSSSNQSLASGNQCFPSSFDTVAFSDDDFFSDFSLDGDEGEFIFIVLCLP